MRLGILNPPSSSSPSLAALWSAQIQNRDDDVQMRTHDQLSYSIQDVPLPRKVKSFCAQQKTMDSLMKDIMTAGASLAKASWEYGTAAEALLELYNPELSVFAADAFPAARIPKPTVDAVPGLIYARKHIRTDKKILIDADGQFAFICSAILAILAQD